MKHKRRVAVVVGSGGIKCAAVLGLWQALGREGTEEALPYIRRLLKNPAVWLSRVESSNGTL